MPRSFTGPDDEDNPSYGRSHKSRDWRTDPDAAYEKAQSKIAAVAARKGTVLELTGLVALVKLPPLNKIENLRTLNIKGTRITDLEPLISAPNLTSLYAQETRIRDISPVAMSRKLVLIDLQESEVDDLAALADLPALQFINLRNTKVSDLRPLEQVSDLKSLGLRKTLVSDLTPLRHSSRLLALDISHTKVSDLTPLSALTQLESLKLQFTPVSDLSPLSSLNNLTTLDLNGSAVRNFNAIAELTELANGALKDAEGGGLFFSNCAGLPQELQNLTSMVNPERTLEALNYVRENEGLPNIDTEFGNDKAFLDDKNKNGVIDPDTVPNLPPQLMGPQFALAADGRIVNAPIPVLDDSGNDLATLNSLHPMLTEIAAALLDHLSNGNVPHAHLLSVVSRYFDEINKPAIVDIDFTRVCGCGFRLANAADADEKRVRADELPELTDVEEELLNSLLQINASFVLATRVGKELVSSVDRYRRKPDEEKQIRHYASLLANELGRHPEVITREASETITEAVNGMGEGPQASRTNAFGEAATTNVAIVLTGAAALYLVPTAVGWLISGPLGGVIGAGVGVLGQGVLEKTKAFDAATSRTAHIIDQRVKNTTAWVASIGKGTFESYLRFVLASEATLRGLARTHFSMRWLNKHLDWLKRTVTRLQIPPVP